MISVICSSRYKIQSEKLKRFARGVLDGYHVSPDTGLNIVFVGRRKMKQIAATYKNEDVALPVLSFPYVNDPEVREEKIVGEVVMCYPQAVLLAAEREKKVQQMIEQLLEHGIETILTHKTT